MKTRVARTASPTSAVVRVTQSSEVDVSTYVSFPSASDPTYWTQTFDSFAFVGLLSCDGIKKRTRRQRWKRRRRRGRGRVGCSVRVTNREFDGTSQTSAARSACHCEHAEHGIAYERDCARLSQARPPRFFILPQCTVVGGDFFVFAQSHTSNAHAHAHGNHTHTHSHSPRTQREVSGQWWWRQVKTAIWRERGVAGPPREPATRQHHVPRFL